MDLDNLPACRRGLQRHVPRGGPDKCPSGEALPFSPNSFSGGSARRIVMEFERR